MSLGFAHPKMIDEFEKITSYAKYSGKTTFFLLFTIQNRKLFPKAGFI